jgi:hypothetical protein
VDDIGAVLLDIGLLRKHILYAPIADKGMELEINIKPALTVRNVL